MKSAGDLVHWLWGTLNGFLFLKFRHDVILWEHNEVFFSERLMRETLNEWLHLVKAVGGTALILDVKSELWLSVGKLSIKITVPGKKSVTVSALSWEKKKGRNTFCPPPLFLQYQSEVFLFVHFFCLSLWIDPVLSHNVTWCLTVSLLTLLLVLCRWHS